MKRIFVVGVLFGLISCGGDNHDTEEPVTHQPDARIVTPGNNDQLEVGDIIEVEIEINNPDAISDLKLFVADTLYADQIEKKSQVIDVDFSKSKVGWVFIKLSYLDADGKEHGDTRKLEVYSSVVPKQKTAKIVTSYPHGINRYTQGLEFHNGKLFESTGQWGSSSVFEIDLMTGEQLREVKILDMYFGEGITVLNDTIYQLTWQNSLCFLYDMDFNKISEFTYSGEGWGLCNDGQYLIMTDGSEKVVWRDPRTFEIVKTIYVFSDMNSVNNLNEVEMIDGNLWANIYTENRLVEIDTATGAVLSYIDCNSLVSEKPIGSDVLNGIAQNPENGKIYLTGKMWDKLYEVTIE